MDSNLSIQAGQFSDKGVKPSNEDCCGLVIPKGSPLKLKGIAIVIADGVSSSSAGREASEACVQGFLSDYYSTPDSWSVTTAVQKVLGALNRWLHGKGQFSYGHAHGMLTTLSALVLKSATAHLFHIGDTRIYLFRNKDLELLTRDHQTWESNDKSYLSRAMGADISLDIDYRKVEMQPGDIFLLTTDGVHGFLSHEQLQDLLFENRLDVDLAAKVIVQKAVENNSNDNVTCQVIKIDQLDSRDNDDFYKHLTALPFPPPLDEGMTLDGYTIIKELHASKRTQVYLALDKETNQKVILKTPSVNYEDDPQYIEQFLYEEWACKRIKNRNVAKALNTHRSKQFLYNVSEYVDGVTLRQWMSEHPRAEIKEVREIVKQIANGLRAFHRLEMLHQDLKPENVMLDAQGTVKIIDFGSTKIAGIAEITTPIERLSLLGTQNYTAPEYILGQAGSNRSDIFSLGVISYELLCGKHPYGNGLETIKKAKGMAKLVYTPCHQYNPMVPVWMDKAIEKAVNLNPKHRYALLSEFIHDISFPNLQFSSTHFIPLVDRNPILFWQVLTTILLLANLISLYFLWH